MITRRQLMATGAVVAAAGAGVAVGAVRPVRIHRTAGVRAPAGLTCALAREQALVAALDTAAKQDPDQRSLAAQIRDDHVAHMAALTSALAPYRDAGPPASGPSVSSPTSSRAQLRAAETSASAAAAADSLTLTGADAALLASISAAEAVHAELLA